ASPAGHRTELEARNSIGSSILQSGLCLERLALIAATIVGVTLPEVIAPTRQMERKPSPCVLGCVVDIMAVIWRKCGLFWH
ncbi:unnamed protein product, partial [Mycena citricolor]